MNEIPPARKRPQLVVLVPAHDEEKQIADTIESLLAQTRPADRIIIASDNSTDATVAIARRYAALHPSVVVFETEDNRFRKAGALNQSWAFFARDADFVLTMDSDTILSETFFEKALATMAEQPNVGGASSCPMLKEESPDLTRWQSVLWRMSKLDFGGYMRILCRWKFRPEVLSGYATIFRKEALDEIALVQSVPWATDSIVEDYRISLDLRRNGWDLLVIPGAVAYTDAPISLRGLWVQRVRWSGGTWQELARAGWTRHTWKVWLLSIWCLTSVAIRGMAATAWILVAILGLPIAWHPVWLIPIIVGIVDRWDITRYTAQADWKDRVLASTLLPMELMGMVREAWTLWSAGTVALRRHLSW